MKSDQNQLINEINNVKNELLKSNPALEDRRRHVLHKRTYNLQKVLVANRGEIAKRFFLSLREENIPSVAVVTDADIGQSWYDFADETIFIGDPRNYVSVPVILAAAIISEANAVYPGYGFLSENVDFVKSLEVTNEILKKNIIFMGPPSKVMINVGNKLKARTLAKENGIPLFEGSESIEEIDKAHLIADKIGYPVIVKLDSGGGGKGMIPVFDKSKLKESIESCQRIGEQLYKDKTFYLEKYIEYPVHIEVQIFNGLSVGVRKCAVQRRNQKIIEESGHSFLDIKTYENLIVSAEKMADISGYKQYNGGAGTVEFLMDSKTGEFGFLEMNTRLQVEYGVTDQALNIDLVKWQILFFDGREKEIPFDYIKKNRLEPKNHSIECRIYAEEPEKNYAPSTGEISDIILPSFNGIRCDIGFKRGDKILMNYDPMIGKLIAYAPNRKEAILRMKRALEEFYISGISTNTFLLLKIIKNKEFINGNYTNRLLIDNSELERSLSEPVIIDDRRSNTPIIFAALAEHITIIQKAAEEYVLFGHIENFQRNHKQTKIPNVYEVEYQDTKYKVKFLQIALDTFYTYINDIYNGKAQITFSKNKNDDYLIRFGLKSIRIRLDRRSNYMILKMKNNESIQYYTLKVFAEDIEKKQDPEGMVRSPFQGTFVALGKEDNSDKKVKANTLKIGSVVSKNQTIMVVSAMKMEVPLTAPIDGKITYIFEDGDLSKLEIGHTVDGLVIGKNVNEGEILFTIEGNESKEKTKEQKTEKTGKIIKNSLIKSNNILDFLFNGDLEVLSIKNPSEYLPQILDIIKTYYLGYNQNMLIFDKLSSILKMYCEKNIIQTDENINNKIIEIIHIYHNVNKIFSPIVEEDYSYFEELNRLIVHWKDFDYKPPEYFRKLLHDIIISYGVEEGVNIHKSYIHSLQMLLNLQKSYDENPKYRENMKSLINILEISKTFTENIHETLSKLLQIEQIQIENSLADYIKLRVKPIFKSVDEDIELKDTELRKLKEKRLTELENIKEHINKNIAKVKESLNNKNLKIIPDNISKSLQLEIEPRIIKLKKKYDVYRLYSPLKDIYIYLLVNKEDKNNKTYVVYMPAKDKLEPEEDEKGQIIRIKNLYIIEAVTLIACYQEIEKTQNNRIEFIAGDNTGNVRLEHYSPKLLESYSQKGSIFNIVYYFTKKIISEIFIHLYIKEQNKIQKKTLSIFYNNDKLQLDLITDDDKNNPYFDSEFNDNNQKLYDLSKWPIEVWAQECFDNSKYQEIKIKSIDNTEWLNPKTEKKEIKPVGAKIFLGKIKEKEAYFYMKDSRISGGATGNLEGLKFLASCYLSYIQQIPLYIWNDGAGANIKEGMVSLNRAAEGFMMNTLLWEKVSKDEFFKYLAYHPDDTIKALFEEIDKQFNITIDHINLNKNNFYTVAVGVGASAGLDVYGSSQAAIQVMLDSQQSYRVLTGSNVIRSVTGEDLTNYEIGGAKVMNQKTGIVDIVAENKVHMINIIKDIHHMFAVYNNIESIQRKILIEKYVSGHKETLSEALIRNNTDDGNFIPFKDKYYGSESLIAGFGKIGGHRVLVMGPRSDFGLISVPSIIKAKEVLRVSYGTSTHQILIMGQKWFGDFISYETRDFRIRFDFLQLLQRKKGIQINIITKFKGLHDISIQSTADIIIFIKTENLEENEYNYVQRVATFIVNDFEEAFNLSQKLINIIDSTNSDNNWTNENSFKENNDTTAKNNKKFPQIPKNLNEPFDIIKSVIDPIVDENTFIEFFKEMNNPLKEACLITGIAKIDNKPIAIIADQPDVLGGAPDAPSTDKFRIFTEIIGKNNIPLLMLSNSPGFVPGTKQERLRIQSIGARSLDINIMSKVPVVSVVLNQNYGGRQIQAFSRYLRPGIVYIAMEKSLMAVMGSSAAFDLFHGAQYNKFIKENKKEEAKKLRETFIDNFNNKAYASNDALSTNILDWIISDIKNLRENIIKGMFIAVKKLNEAFY
ncbi:MAG: hypothetical protein OEZ22_00325 [Spirochaetia bacterium]|nr:hypothetical protein [Spirochaetia bacterium]